MCGFSIGQGEVSAKSLQEGVVESAQCLSLGFPMWSVLGGVEMYPHQPKGLIDMYY